MPVANLLIGLLPMVAWTAGSIVVLALFIGFGVLAIYAIYWISFKMGKD
jgi:hypothetical protein